MKIGIDMHSLGSGNGGNESYYRALLHGLVALNSSHSFSLYTTGSQFQNLASNFREHKVPSSSYLRIPLAFRRRAGQDELDLFHAQFIIPPGLRCRTVTTIPDIAFEHFPECFPAYQRMWSRCLIRASAERADHIITVSEHSKRDLAATYRIPPEKITVTYLAHDPKFYPRDLNASRLRVAEKFGIRNRFVLYVGRLQARKNLARLVEAFAKLDRGFIDYTLVLVGKVDSLFAPVLTQIRECKLENRVLLPGYVPEQELPFLLSAADAFIYPSLYEGFGLPVVEAMACGTPVVTSKGAALEEVAGGAALLCDPMDPISLTECLQRIIDDEGLRNQLSRDGLKRSSAFSEMAMARKTVDVYEHVARVTANSYPSKSLALAREN